MAITVSSTTDSQEAVNAAAGILESTSEATAPAETTTPEAEQPATEEDAARKVAEPEEEEDQQPEDEEEKEPGEEDTAKPRKPGRYERRIDRLEQQLAYERRIRELETQLAGRREPEPPQLPPVTRPKPVQGPTEPYEDYFERLADWKFEQREAQARAVEQRQAESARIAQWGESVQAFRAKAKDFDAVLAAADHIIVPPLAQQAIMTSEHGPALMYALAQDQKELERIARLEPLAAVRELGKLEAMITAKEKATHSAQTTRPPVSQAPEPIRPVGQGASTSTTKSPDEMPYQEYKRWREKQIAARRRTG